MLSLQETAVSRKEGGVLTFKEQSAKHQGKCVLVLAARVVSPVKRRASAQFLPILSESQQIEQNALLILVFTRRPSFD